MSGFERKVARAAVAVSIAFHMVLFLLLALLFAFGIQQAPAVVPEPTPEEYVTITPDLLVEEEVGDPKERQEFVRTDDLDPTEEPESETHRVSDRSTTAASSVSPSLQPEDQVATDGAMDKATDLIDRDFVDGEKSGSTAGGPPSPPAPVSAAVEVAEAIEPDDVSADAKQRKDPDLPELVDTDLGTEQLLDLPPSGEFLELPRTLETVGGAKEPSQDDVEERPKEQEQVVVEEAPKTQPPAAPGAESPPGYIPESRTKKLMGTLDSRNKASFDTKQTPTGKYMAQVTSAVEKRWHFYVDRKREFVTFGSLRVRFSVDRDGNARNLKVLSGDANAIITDFTLSSILEAKIPPIPEELLDLLENEQIEITYNVVIY